MESIRPLRSASLFAMLCMPISFCAVAAELLPGQAPGLSNPILPGYYADPSHVEHEGMHYIYATLDPWGDRTLGCWESGNLKDWSYRALNWPTKEACTSPGSSGAKVWAPSVVKLHDGRFLMAISVGSEVWLGTAPHPLGPWNNTLGDKPLVSRNYYPGFHMIDAELFVEEDGSVLMYWGSGLNWKNGRCWVVRLSDDLTSFADEPVDVTPSRYFEAPLLVKRHGRYFLMYSDGVTIRDTYQVHYAVSDSPRGPFVEGPTSPILITDTSAQVVSPGHHSVVRQDGRDYILYHRHSIPFDPAFIGRQTCIDELSFNTDGTIDIVLPSHTGPAFVQGREESNSLSLGAVVSASSEASANTRAAFVVDANYATRWAAHPDAKGAWLQVDLGEVRAFSQVLVRPEYAWKPLRVRLELSDNGTNWKTLADHTQAAIVGSPLRIRTAGSARLLRLVFPEEVQGKDISLFEVALLR